MMNLNRRQSLVGLFSTAIVGLFGSVALASEEPHELFLRAARHQVKKCGFIAGPVFEFSDVQSTSKTYHSWVFDVSHPLYQKAFTVVSISDEEIKFSTEKGFCLAVRGRVCANNAIVALLQDVGTTI